MIASPGEFSPLAHPEACRARRDWVLGRMAELGWIDRERAARETARPLALNPQNLVVRRAAYFVDAMEAEAAERFGLGALTDAGYVLLATLDWEDQKGAAEAVAWGLPALEEGWEKGNRVAGPLQAALVSLHPGSGAILAYIGGRSYSGSQFDRVGQARRQAGSAFKPVVFAAAFEHGAAFPSSLLEDSPLTVSLAGRTWTPKNHDGSFRGWVTARTALEQSLNIPTARLALQVGLERVVALAREMGISSPLEPVPALALGAFEVSPRELATVYASLAAGGVRPPVHGLSAVLSPDGERRRDEALPAPRRILSAETAYLVNSVLQGVLDRGTGGGARTQGIRDALAGKTGTTNDRRDSWFVGYAPDRVTLVWVGYDDNSRTRLSGSRAALPIWARFTRAVRPTDGYPSFPQPRGIATAVVDPLTGQLATDACPEVLTEVFPAGRVPREICDLHRGWFADPLDQPAGVEVEQVHPIRRWLQRVFGRERDEGRP
jgi:penicillin-binding protein 1B